MSTLPALRARTVTVAADDAVEARLSIGALSRATAIPIETLRTWEARYGFPVPERKPSGHRLYQVSSVARLRRIAEALARGHRASAVLTTTDAQLSHLLASTVATVDAHFEGDACPDEDLRVYLDAVAGFDAGRLAHLLHADWDRLGLMAFLCTRLVPLIELVGDAWQAGTLSIRHEHFFSQRVDDVLRALRGSLEADAAGPVVVFATLPGETHGLGLQMAALVAAAQRCRVLYLGTDTPPEEIAGLAGDIHARAVAVSISVANAGPMTQAHLAVLRRILPRRVALVVGGAGAEAAVGDVRVTRVTDFSTLAAWAAGVAA